MIQKRVSRLVNNKKWQPFPIAPATSIPSYKLKSGINPFNDLQDKYTLATSSYFKGTITLQRDLLLLDPINVQIANLKLESDQLNIKDAYKWGSWGRWNGKMMNPKGICYLSSFDLVAVSDSLLKVVQLFDLKGNFISLLHDEAGTANYPIDLACVENQVYIADFLKEKVTGIEITALHRNALDSKVQLEDLLHRNLYNHPQIQTGDKIRTCLNCHDGMSRFDLDHFLPSSNQHPINIKYGKDTDLLLNKGLIDCTTCHNAHHGQEGGAPFNLQMQPKQLCLSCHEEMKTPSKHYKEEDSCLKCHQVHGGHQHLQNMPPAKSCIKCHNKQTKNLTHPISLSENPQSTRPVACLTCHKMHDVNKHPNFARISKTGKTCESCHQQQAEKLGKNSHIKANKKTQKLEWPEPGSNCLKCHHPHGSKKVKSNCISCHQSLTQRHPVKAGIIPRNKDCLQCHEAHGIEGHSKYLMQPKEHYTKEESCKKCHKRLQPMLSHPLNQEVSCQSCHATHAPKEKMKSCQNCHQKIHRQVGRNPHMQSKKSNQQLVCSHCHNPHAQKKPKKEQCTHCHKEKKGEHEMVAPIADSAKNQGYDIFQDQIVCTTCHDPHQHFGRKFLARPNQLKILCASCHGKETEKLFNNYHQLLK